MKRWNKSKTERAERNVVAALAALVVRGDPESKHTDAWLRAFDELNHAVYGAKYAMPPRK